MKHLGAWREPANQAVELDLFVLAQGPQVLAQVRLQAFDGVRAHEPDAHGRKDTTTEG
jgi:hypothetical protein